MRRSGRSPWQMSWRFFSNACEAQLGDARLLRGHGAGALIDRRQRAEPRVVGVGELSFPGRAVEVDEQSAAVGIVAQRPHRPVLAVERRRAESSDDLLLAHAFDTV